MPSFIMLRRGGRPLYGMKPLSGIRSFSRVRPLSGTRLPLQLRLSSGTRLSSGMRLASRVRRSDDRIAAPRRYSDPSSGGGEVLFLVRLVFAPADLPGATVLALIRL